MEGMTHSPHGGCRASGRVSLHVDTTESVHSCCHCVVIFHYHKKCFKILISEDICFTNGKCENSFYGRNISSCVPGPTLDYSGSGVCAVSTMYMLQSGRNNSRSQSAMKLLCCPPHPPHISQLKDMPRLDSKRKNTSRPM